MWDMHRRSLAVTLACTGAALLACVVLAPRPAPELVVPAVVAMLLIVALVAVIVIAPTPR
jgi:hypothetical protein